jgi:hypothetical protein
MATSNEKRSILELVPETSPTLRDYAEADARVTHELYQKLKTVPRPIDPEHIARYTERTIQRMIRLLNRVGRPFTLHGHAVIKGTEYELTYEGATRAIRFGDGHIRIDTTQIPVRRRRVQPDIFVMRLMVAMR